MHAKIVKHAEFDDVADDPDHPIPAVGAIDINAVKKNGGAELTIVTASPLMKDDRSQNRLLDKIDLYLRFISSPQFQKEAGLPSPEKTLIVVRISRYSDALIFDLLERSKKYVRENSATLSVVKLD